MVWCCVPGRGRGSLPLALLPPTSACSSPCHLRFCLVIVILAGLFLPSAQTFAPMTDSERPRYRTAYACEGSTLNMECDPGHVINLIRANYGRFSITICNEHGNTEWSVNCMSPRSHRVLHDKCSQRQNCSVAASTRGFGDPCPGTLKYLEAHFQCVDVNPPSHTARPRPPWFIATKTTVSSITEDGPPLPSPPTKGGSVPVGGSGGGIGGPFGVGEGRLGGDGIGDSGEVITGIGEDGSDPISKEGLPFENRLKEPPAEDLPHSITASSSTTTTLRPPPWLITNTTKNTTLSTTTTSTTSTTTTTPKPPSTTTTTTSKPQTNLDSPVNSPASEDGDGVNNQVNGEGGVEDEDDDDASPTELYDVVESDRFPSNPVSTTTPWPVRAEVPVTEGAAMGSEASWCPPSSDRSLVWNWTQGGEVAIQPCPGGASGWARRSCNPLGWSGPADLSECRSVWLTTLTSRAHASDAVLAVAHDLAIVTGSRALYGGDVTATANLINSLARRMAEDVSNFPDRAQREAMVTELVGAVVATGSHLVGRQRAAWGDLRPPEHQAAATALLLGLEEAAFLLADNLHQEKTVIHAESNILLRLQVLETRNVVAVSFPSPGEAWLPSSPTRPSDPSSSPTAPLATTSSYLDTVPSAPMSDFPQDVASGTPKVPLDSITLPPEAMLENADNGLVKIVFFSFDGLHHMLQPNGGLYHFNFKGVNRTRVLNSRVLSASLGAGRHIELSEPVVLTFAMIRTVNVTNPACVFWDYTTSSWSEEGCSVLRYNTSHTVCECEHLTNFAVLMDVHATPLPYPHQLALSIITYVGCIISIVCLLLATIVFHAFRGLKSDRTTIHKNLCVCLLVAEIVFLAGVNQTDKPEVCGVVAGLLHFFLLAAFCWMFMEGFQLYVMLVEVFESEKPRARWYYAASYGFPAVVVAVSAVVDPFSYGTKDACWLKTDNYFIFAFVGPVIAIIIANCIFLGMAMFIMCRTANISASLKNKEHTKLASVNSGNEENALLDKFQKHAIWVRGAIILIVLLGLTWTFGLLYLNQATVVMAYIFTVLNSLQGLFIFIFHCVQNEKVKKELRRAGRRHPWLRACLCAAHDRSHTTTKDARTTSHNAASHSHSNSHASHTTLVPHLTSGRWTRGGSKGSNTTSSSQAGTMSQPQLPPTTTPVRGGSLSRASMSRGSLSRTPQRNSSGRSARHLHHTLHTRTVTGHDHDEEKYSFKSSGRDSGHGGSEQEDSPRTGSAAKLAALHLNNSVAPHLTPDHLVNPFTASNGAIAAANVVHEQATPGPEALLPDYRLAEGTPSLRVPAGNSVIGRGHRTHSPWNHTYTEIPDGNQAGRQSNLEGSTDPVYEEIEREVRSDLQMSDLSDEDGRRHSSDISRQSSRSYGDHRPLLPYTLSEHHHSSVPHHHQLTHYDPRFKARIRHQENLEDLHSRTLPGSRIGPQLDHTVVSPGHILPMTHAAVTSAHALPHGNGHIASQQFIDESHTANSMHHMLDGGRQIVEYNQAMLAALGGGHTLPVVHPLSEPNLRNWEAAQRHRDLQQLQQLGEMTVAVLSGEQVVCKLKPPLAPIHENSAGVQAERHPPPPTYSHC